MTLCTASDASFENTEAQCCIVGFAATESLATWAFTSASSSNASQKLPPCNCSSHLQINQSQDTGLEGLHQDLSLLMVAQCQQGLSSGYMARPEKAVKAPPEPEMNLQAASSFPKGCSEQSASDLSPLQFSLSRITQRCKLSKLIYVYELSVSSAWILHAGLPGPS